MTNPNHLPHTPNNDETNGVVRERPAAPASNTIAMNTNTNTNTTTTATTTTTDMERSFFPRARDHGYLPGTCHPLCTTLPSGLLSSSSCSSSSSSSSRPQLQALLILEYPGDMVLFPGSTFPLRLFARRRQRRHAQQYQHNDSDPSQQTLLLWEWLRRQIQSHRFIVAGETTTTTTNHSLTTTNTNTPIQLGILAPESSMVEDDDEEDDAEEGEETGDDSDDNTHPDNHHHIVRNHNDEDTTVPHQRSFWARRAFRLFTTTTTTTATTNTTNTNTNTNIRTRGQQQQELLLRRTNHNHRRRSRMGRDDSRRSFIRVPSDTSQQQNSIEDLYVGRVGTIVTVMNTYSDETFTTGSADMGTTERTPTTSTATTAWQSLLQASETDTEDSELIVTCLATSRFRIVQATPLGRDQDRTIHTQYRQRRLLNYHDTMMVLGSSYPLSTPTTAGGNPSPMTGLLEPWFLVEEIPDITDLSSTTTSVTMVVPPPRRTIVPRTTLSSPPTSLPSSSSSLPSLVSRNVSRYLAMITPWPEYLYRQYWLASRVLLEQIKQDMSQRPSYRDLYKKFRRLQQPQPQNQNQPTPHEQTQTNHHPSDHRFSCTSVTGEEGEWEWDCHDPVLASYWMASNFPLKVGEKVKLLKMRHVVQRLRWLLTKIQGASTACSTDNPDDTTTPFLACKRCHQSISSARYLFTVGGADGTTGAYVNEYGYIHQTITVRRIWDEYDDDDDNDDHDTYTSRDSWFSGYEWIILYCFHCGSHVGWKFRRVMNTTTATTTATTTLQQRQSLSSTAGYDDDSDEDRPPFFYGLSASNVCLLRTRRAVSLGGTGSSF